jgi:hypothetical protein
LKSTPTFHEVVGGSGRLIQRGFCGKCGSMIDPSAFQPTTEIWLSRAKPWHPVHPGTMKFEGRPISGVKDKLDEYFAKRAGSNAAMS